MAFEKTLPAVPVQLISADGGLYGQLQVPSTDGFKLKQKVTLVSNTQIPTFFEVKNVVDTTHLILGPYKSIDLLATSNLSLFTVSTNATISAAIENRQNIPPELFMRAVYEESPTVAIRTFAVDSLGNKYTKSNPFPVQLSDGSINIETLNAELRVQLSAKDNDPTAGDIHSSVRVGDGTNELKVNADGSINAVIESGGGGTTFITKNTYDEVLVVPGIQTEIVAYTVPSGKTAILEIIAGSGQQVGRFDVFVNQVVMDTARNFYGNFNIKFNFRSSGSGLSLVAGDVVTLKATQSIEDPSLFSGRIQVAESS